MLANFDQSFTIISREEYLRLTDIAKHSPISSDNVTISVSEYIRLQGLEEQFYRIRAIVLSTIVEDDSICQT